MHERKQEHTRTYIYYIALVEVDDTVEFSLMILWSLV